MEEPPRKLQEFGGEGGRGGLLLCSILLNLTDGVAATCLHKLETVSLSRTAAS